VPLCSDLPHSMDRKRSMRYLKSMNITKKRAGKKT
jgi:hypothetical protein